MDIVFVVIVFINDAFVVVAVIVTVVVVAVVVVVLRLFPLFPEGKQLGREFSRQTHKSPWRRHFASNKDYRGVRFTKSGRFLASVPSVSFTKSGTRFLASVTCVRSTLQISSAVDTKS